jgi:hypothetical protein
LIKGGVCARFSESCETLSIAELLKCWICRVLSFLIYKSQRWTRSSLGNCSPFTIFTYASDMGWLEFYCFYSLSVF